MFATESEGSSTHSSECVLNIPLPQMSDIGGSERKRLKSLVHISE